MEFLYADDVFSIFIFVVVMIVVFILLLNILMGIITLIMNAEEVYVIKGMVPGNVSKTIQVNPKNQTVSRLTGQIIKKELNFHGQYGSM